MIRKEKKEREEMKENNEEMKKVIDEMKKEGIEDRDIKKGGINIKKIYVYNEEKKKMKENKIKGYYV